MSRAGELRIGTRGSDLALWQARRVAHRLRDELSIAASIEVIATRGDRVRTVAFHKMEGKGFFTKELQEALLDGRVDLVVHSLKDLPTEHPSGLLLAAVPERGPATDLLLAAAGSLTPTPADPLGLAEGAVLGTSSLRRAAQALALRPDLRIRALRGNVPTRVDRLRRGDYDAILLATAGVQRLELDLGDLDVVELPAEVMLPAPGQGALAIECRAGDPAVEGLEKLHDAAVGRCVETERRLLQLLGGGCHLPLGCLATETGDAIRLQAVLGEVDDEVRTAELARVAAVADAPEIVAQACRSAIELAMPARRSE